MIITNTTFVASAGKDADALCRWLKEVYVTKARESHLFDDVILTHILTRHDPEADSYAVQLVCEDPHVADRWLTDVRPLLCGMLVKELPGEGRTVWFTSQMEVIK